MVHLRYRHQYGILANPVLPEGETCLKRASDKFLGPGHTSTKVTFPYTICRVDRPFRGVLYKIVYLLQGDRCQIPPRTRKRFHWVTLGV